MDLKEIMLAQGYHRMDVQVAVGGYEEVPQLDPDLMHIKFIMCHEGVNANGDTFTKEVLKQAQYTPKNKPVDWEHGQPIVGTILDSVYKEDVSGVGYIEATGVIWKFMYPELSAQIKAKSKTGELRLSMECYFKDANYQVGDQIFDQEQAERMGIPNYVGREYMGKKVARVFKEVIFGGVGVVANPADKKAVFLSVAKDLGLENPEEAVAGLVQRSVNDYSQRQPSKEANHAMTVAKFIKAFDKAKSSIVSKFNKEQIVTKDQMVAEVRNSVNTLLSEVSSISTAYYKGTASEEDTLEDKIQEVLASALNTDSAEAYLRTLEEGYVTYDVIDYSLTEQIKSFKASFSNSDDSIEIDFANANEITLEKGVIEEMTDANKTEATELETPVVETPVEEVVASEEEVATEVVEEVVATQEEVVEEVVAEDQAQASELEATVASLKAELEVERAEKQALADKIADFEARFAALEADKVLASRLADLKESGIEFTGSRLEKESARIKSMSDEDFADHKELLLEVAGKKVEVSTASEEVEEEVDEATASTDEVEEDIVVEGAKASAGLVVEEIARREVRPFGHLARK